MPSGRSGGSSRTMSSRGGGASRTMSSRGGSGFSSSPNRGGHHRGGHHRGGRNTVVIVGGRRRGGWGWCGGHGWHTGGGRTIGVLGVFAVLAVFAALIGLMIMLAANSDMRRIETEHLYYQTMITSNVATREARVTDHWMNDRGGKWWFEYEIIPQGADSTNPMLLSGWSLPIYNHNQLPAIDSIITVVLSHSTIGNSTNSVPARPQDIALTQYVNDGDWIDAQRMGNGGSWTLYISGALFVLFIVAEIAIITRLRRNRNNDVQPAMAGGPTGSPQQSQPQSSNCPFCGVRTQAQDRNCTSCGGRL